MENNNKKYKLSNLVLYAKGWYHKTDDVWVDLFKILELDDYTPFTKEDIFSIIVSSLEKTNFEYRFNDLKEVLFGIYPSECWKVGYYVKENSNWSNKPKEELPDYDMPTAFIYYVLSNLRFLSNEHWIPKVPQYKKYPKAKHITYKNVFEHFNSVKINVTK
jgi:hypothetical protein